MASPSDLIFHYVQQPWLLGLDPAQVQHRFQHYQADLAGLSGPEVILLTEADPTAFLAGLLAAIATPHTLILGNPRWSLAEWQQAIQLTHPTRYWPHPPIPVPPHPPLSLPSQPLILIPTSGSSGHLRFVTHTWATLSASVLGFQQFFQRSPLHACCVLPLYHVSGLMQVMRSLLTQGKLAIHPYKSLEAGILPPLDPTDYFLSLVPTQLHRLLAQPRMVDWLRCFHTILLGGAPPWPDLLAQGRQEGLPLSPTYGMTETASQIATQKPEDFLAGHAGYSLLPHAQITLAQQEPGSGAGLVQIQAQSLALGYYPDLLTDPCGFLTDDLGRWDAQGRLRIIGRASDKIITGGENVFPAEVEAAIRATGLVQDVAVLGMGDRQWGECVTALYVPSADDLTPAQMQAALQPYLSRFKQPKHWISVASLPRNAQGKLNRLTLKQLALARLA